MNEVKYILNDALLENEASNFIIYLIWEGISSNELKRVFIQFISDHQVQKYKYFGVP